MSTRSLLRPEAAHGALVWALVFLFVAFGIVAITVSGLLIVNGGGPL